MMWKGYDMAIAITAACVLSRCTLAQLGLERKMATQMSLDSMRASLLTGRWTLSRPTLMHLITGSQACAEETVIELC